MNRNPALKMTECLDDQIPAPKRYPLHLLKAHDDASTKQNDTAFGFKHRHRFTRIAIVTESSWLRAAVTMFCPFFPSEIRLFRLSERDAAKDWITRTEKAGA